MLAIKRFTTSSEGPTIGMCNNLLCQTLSFRDSIISCNSLRLSISASSCVLMSIIAFSDGGFDCQSLINKEISTMAKTPADTTPIKPAAVFRIDVPIKRHNLQSFNL